MNTSEKKTRLLSWTHLRWKRKFLVLSLFFTQPNKGMTMRDHKWKKAASTFHFRFYQNLAMPYKQTHKTPISLSTTKITQIKYIKKTFTNLQHAPLNFHTAHDIWWNLLLMKSVCIIAFVWRYQMLKHFLVSEYF